MITKLNLASKPFTNRTLPWVVTVVVLVFSLLAFILIVRSTAQTNSQIHFVQADISQLKEQEQSLRKRAETVQNSLTPEQLQTLSAAHVLVDRKSFSWSRLFSDLEAALPGSVRVKRISVRDVAARSGETVAELDLTVVAKSASAVTNMIADMDRGGVFQSELRSQNLQKGRGETGTEYELYVLYRARRGVPTNDTQARQITEKEGALVSRAEEK